MTVFRKTLRALRKRLVGSQGQLSALTKTDASPIPIAVMTISDIERGKNKDPGIVTVHRLIEAMPGMTLSSFFARIEGLPVTDELGDNSEPPATQQVADHESLPKLASQRQIDLAVIGYLAELAFNRSPAKLGTDDRYAAAARRAAAKLRRDRGKGRPRHAQSKKTRGSRKRD